MQDSLGYSLPPSTNVLRARRLDGGKETFEVDTESLKESEKDV